MKLIKINTDHYVVVDDSEIKEGDYYVRTDTNLIFSTLKGSNPHIIEKYCKKITHSTNIDWNDVYYIPLHEVKELIGEVDVEKKANEEYKDNLHNPFFTAAPMGYIKGYNQALEDNKDKKYTEEQVKEACRLFVCGKTLDSCIKSLQPKTEWEVEFVDGKLKLKS